MTLPLVVRTARLELTAAEPGVARGEANSTTGWYGPLEVPPPPAWPPPLNDARSLAWFARSIASDPAGLGWYGWYVVSTQNGGRALIGNGGFKGRPDARGSVEIGYSLLPEHQRKGFGTELTAALVSWAFGHGAVARVMAETLPELVGSIRVLEKNGFEFVGRGSEPGIILFELRRSVFERRTAANGATALDSQGSR
jgi:RimJ/RimL family protein N-acetyltransferase